MIVHTVLPLFPVMRGNRWLIPEHQYIAWHVNCIRFRNSSIEVYYVVQVTAEKGSQKTPIHRQAKTLKRP